MRRHVVSAFCLAVVLGLAARTSLAQRGWPHEESDLAPDATATWGSLPNGLRYAIVPHTDPAENGRVSLRLIVDAGSLMEEDHQQGLAHFLEHMAFNGTRNFPAGEMLKYFQRLGMAFGAHTNAVTGFQTTVYMLELPKNTDAYLGEALTLLRDYADGMLLDDEEISRERGVILSEKLSGESAARRTIVETIGFLLPHTPLARRLPIGQEDVIRRVAREDFAEFYGKWYTPDRMTLVVVGAVDPTAIAALLEEKLGGLAAPAMPVPDPDLGGFVPVQGLDVKLHTEMESGTTGISLVALHPASGVDDGQSLREDVPRVLADFMLGRRFTELTRGEDPPFTAATSLNVDYLDANLVEADCVEISCPPEDWERALSAGEQELRRALMYGFSETEFQQAASSFLAYLQDAAARADSRRAADVADALVRSLGTREVFTHPRDDLARFNELLAETTVDDCAAALRNAWSVDGLKILVQGNLVLEDGERKIEEAFLKSSQTPVEPRADQQQPVWAYADFGPAGKVARQEEIADLDVTLLSYENNVRLNLKRTDWEADAIHITVNFGAGRLTANKELPGLLQFAAGTFLQGGLEQHSLDDVNRLCMGRNVQVNFNVEEESFTLTGTTNGKDLEFQLQLLCAYLAAPGFREDSLAAYRQNIEATYNALAHNVEGLAETTLPAILHQGDARFAFPRREELSARTMSELREALASALQTSWLEIAVAGDFDPQTVADAVGKTFGALPPRESARPDYASERMVADIDAAAANENLIRFGSQTTKAVGIAYWSTPPVVDDAAVACQWDVLAAILGDRVREKVREELGETYTPSVWSSSNTSFADGEAVVCQFTCEAGQGQALTRTVAELAAALAAEGATADELTRAQQPLANRMAEILRLNRWWAYMLGNAQARPWQLDWMRGLRTGYQDVRLDDVNRLAKEHLAAGNARAVCFIPDERAPSPAAE